MVVYFWVGGANILVNNVVKRRANRPIKQIVGVFTMLGPYFVLELNIYMEVLVTL